MVSIDNDTDSAGSLDLDGCLDDIITYLRLPQLPSCDLGEKPTSIATELKTNGTKATVPRTKINENNFNEVSDKLKDVIETLNNKIDALRKLAAAENKQRLDTYDGITQHANDLDAYLKSVMKKVGKMCEDNKHIVEKLRAAKDTITKLREGKKTCADEIGRAHV